MRPAIQIVPTILVTSADEFVKSLTRLGDDFERAQIDVMDGRFVPNTTYFDVAEIKKYPTSLSYEIHLMVQDPLSQILALKGFARVTRVFFHYESNQDTGPVAQAIRSLGFSPGLAVNPDTDLEEIKNEMIDFDVIMLMGVRPGFAGQPLLPKTVQRVRTVRAFHPGIEIEVDGGVNDATARDLVVAGANTLAVGSFLYQGNPADQKAKIINSLI